MFGAGTEGAVFQMTPTVADGTVIVGVRERYLYAVDADDGSEQWRFENGAIAGWSSVAVANGEVYVGDAIGVGQGDRNDNLDRVVRGYARKDSQFYALDLQDGSVIWSRTDEKVATWMGPVVADGVVYVGTDYNKFYAFDAETGETQ